MKKRIALVSTILALTALAAFARPGHGGRHHQGFGGGAGLFGHLDRIKTELNLTDNQVAQIKVIFAELREQNADSRQSMHGGFKDVAQLLLANPNDLTGAQALIDRQAAAERTMKTNMLNATSKALNVLTAEQRAELAKKMEERAQRMQQRRNR